MKTYANDRKWGRETYPSISQLGSESGATVVLPVGSIEQHGYHLPVSTDTLLVERVVRESVERCREEDRPVIDTPPVWTGCSAHHRSFGGTLSVSHETLLRILSDVADSALDNGFDALVLVNGHGGNHDAIGCAISDIGATHPDVQVSGVTYFDLAATVVEDVRDSDPGGMAHGGEFETSLMLHCYPDLVRSERAEGEPLEEPGDRGLVDMFEAGPVRSYRPFEEYSESGAIGIPDLASAEKGEHLFEAVVTELSDVLSGVVERNQ